MLRGLVEVPEDTCEWIARKEVAKRKAGSVEDVEVRVRELLAEMLKRVPWAGHAWERRQQKQEKK